MAVPNSNWPNDFIATTLRLYDKTMRSQILDGTMALQAMKRKAMDEVDGGRELAYPIIFDDNDTFKTYEQDDDLDLSPQTGLTHANYAWRQANGNIIITGIDLFRNKNQKSKIVDLLDYKIRQLRESVSYKLTTWLLGAQSGKNPLGLRDLVASSNNTVGGINSSTYSWWRNEKYSTATFGTSINGNGFNRLQNLQREANKNGQDPDLWLTSRFLYGAMELSLNANKRFTRDDRAVWGFNSIPFKGAEIVFDGQSVSGSVFLLNTKDIRMVFGKGANFKLEQKVAPANKDEMIWSYTTYFANVAKQRRTSALLYGCTAL